MAGDNRKELQQVLGHYEGDSLKHKAACFLIENMIGKGTIRYLLRESDSCYIQQEPEPDLTCITADYLIENIDLAFEVWQKYPWCKQLSLESLSEYIALSVKAGAFGPMAFLLLYTL